MAKSALQQMAIGRKEMYILKMDDIVVDQKWNERNLGRSDVKEHIDGLALSISKVGIKQPLTVANRDGKPHLTDGFCRMAAARIAIEKYGADIKGVPCIPEEKGSNEADHVLSMLTRNEGLPLTFSEQARAVKRLLAFEWTKHEIADKTGKSITHIDNCVMLLSSDPSIMRHVDLGDVSARFALETIRKYDEGKAVKISDDAVHGAKKAGKKKATNRTAKGSYGLPIRTIDGKGIQWAKHGPEFFRLLEQLESAFDAADTVPDSIGDIVTWYKQYKEDKKLTASAGKKAGE